MFRLNYGEKIGLLTFNTARSTCNTVQKDKT